MTNAAHFEYGGDVFVAQQHREHVDSRQAYLARFRINVVRQATMPRRPSRAEADARTHPSGDFRMPFTTTTNLAEAEPLLAEYAARMCDWGAERFNATSGEARFLRAVSSLDLLLRITPPPDDYNQAHWNAVLAQTRTIMNLRLEVGAFSLSFEHDGRQYDVNETVSCVHAAAVHDLLSLFLST